MDSDRIKGPLKDVGGKLKEGWGEATNDPETEAEGQSDQLGGKVQNDWGETKDDVRDVFDKDRR